MIAHLGLEDETAKEVSESSGKERGIREGETLRHKIIVDMNLSAAVMEVCELVSVEAAANARKSQQTKKKA